jgi:hypothetical protein
MPYKDKTSPRAIEVQKRSAKKYYENNKEAQFARNKGKKDDIRSYIQQYKEYRGCMDCKGKFPFYVLDLDHRDPTTKRFLPSRLAKNNSWDTMIAELAKCDVVCANCHRVRTHNKGHYTHKNTAL